jgi:hypothetical protein
MKKPTEADLKRLRDEIEEQWRTGKMDRQTVLEREQRLRSDFQQQLNALRARVSALIPKQEAQAEQWIGQLSRLTDNLLDKIPDVPGYDWEPNEIYWQYPDGSGGISADQMRHLLHTLAIVRYGRQSYGPAITMLADLANQGRVEGWRPEAPTVHPPTKVLGALLYALDPIGNCPVWEGTPSDKIVWRFPVGPKVQGLRSRDIREIRRIYRRAVTWANSNAVEIALITDLAPPTREADLSGQIRRVS